MHCKWVRMEISEDSATPRINLEVMTFDLWGNLTKDWIFCGDFYLSWNGKIVLDFVYILARLFELILIVDHCRAAIFYGCCKPIFLTVYTKSSMKKEWIYTSVASNYVVLNEKLKHNVVEYPSRLRPAKKVGRACVRLDCETAQTWKWYSVYEINDTLGLNS